MLHAASSPISVRNRNRRAIQSNRNDLYRIFKLPTLSWRKKAQIKLQHNCEEKRIQESVLFGKAEFQDRLSSSKLLSPYAYTSSAFEGQKYWNYKLINFRVSDHWQGSVAATIYAALWSPCCSGRNKRFTKASDCCKTCAQLEDHDKFK